MNALRHYLLALQFFTCIPVTGKLAAWVGYSPQMLRASAGHFPGVGLIVGAVAAGVYAALAHSLPATLWTPLLAAVLSTVATVLLTGAFHEDGLADVADGLGGSSQRERALEIMKDSRVGAFGALALTLGVLTKVALLALLGSMDWQRVCAALLLAHVASRAAALLPIHMLPYVGDSAVSKSKPLADKISPAGLGVACGWLLLTVLLVAGLLGWVTVAISLVVTGGAMVWMVRIFRRRLNGFTGDCLGATQQVCELSCYLALALALSA